ncbi:MAG: efflux RND transporter periplasmic adaptor subunit [Deltaproteobacteria bacterium]|nr:efflux RND transporter periplasmic adaptor subunit [Deltaproteobacteria bacterium]
MIKRIIIILLILGGIGSVVYWNMGPKESVRIEVLCEKARAEAITQVVTASGKIRPETVVNVAADAGGYILQLTVEEGDTVSKDQLLVQIDPEIYRARVQESRAMELTAQANVKLAQAALQRAQGDAKRMRGLHAKDLTSRANLERSQADEAIANAEVDAASGRLLQAQASLSKTRKDLAKCTISASMDGTVILLNKEVGERVSGGDFREDIIMMLADLSSMEVEVEVGERDVVLIDEGDKVDIEVDAFPGKIVAGHVKEVAKAGTTRNPYTESEVTNFRVVVQVDDTQVKVRPQMSATVKIRTDHKEEALTVPIQSVTLRRPSEIKDPVENETKDESGERKSKGESDGGKVEGEPDLGNVKREEPVEVVFVVEEGRSMARRVKTGLSSDTRIEIQEGLKAGEQVVSGPYRALSKDLQHGDDVDLEAAERRGKKGSGKAGRPRRRGRKGRR